jgi:hypothetical protein
MKSPQAAIKGKSELDKTPKEYKEFLDYIVQNPNWIDEFEIVEILEQYVIPASEGGKRKSKRNTRNAVCKTSRKTSRKTKRR